MNARQRLAREAELIMYGGGFRQASVDHFGQWWRVRGTLSNGDEHSGTTVGQADAQDPRILARHIVSMLARRPEPEQIPAHEAHGETGAATDDRTADKSCDQADLGQRPEPGPSAGTDEIRGEVIDERPCNQWPGGSTPERVLDAAFAELPELGQELSEEHPQEYGEGPAFIFGDNIDQRRTAAIGIVVQMALERMPPAIDYARMAELRNFVMGVSEGRWPDDPVLREELDHLEAIERLRRSIEAVRDAKVSLLVNASREYLDLFDPAEGWP